MTQTMPTDEQLKAYADKLPEVYKWVLEAYPESQEPRRHGDALSYDTINDYVESCYELYRPGDTEVSIRRLVERGFLRKADVPVEAYAPTSLGERLITFLTGKVPEPEQVPELPELTWSS